MAGGRAGGQARPASLPCGQLTKQRNYTRRGRRVVVVALMTGQSDHTHYRRGTATETDRSD